MMVIRVHHWRCFCVNLRGDCFQNITGNIYTKEGLKRCTVLNLPPDTAHTHHENTHTHFRTMLQPVWRHKDLHTHADTGSAAGGGWRWHEHGTQSHVVCTVTGLAGTGNSRKLIGLSRANGMAGRGLKVTWSAREAERKKQSITQSLTHTTHLHPQRFQL